MNVVFVLIKKLLSRPGVGPSSGGIFGGRLPVWGICCHIPSNSNSNFTLICEFLFLQASTAELWLSTCRLAASRIHVAESTGWYADIQASCGSAASMAAARKSACRNAAKVHNATTHAAWCATEKAAAWTADLSTAAEPVGSDVRAAWLTLRTLRSAAEPYLSTGYGAAASRAALPAAILSWKGAAALSGSIANAYSSISSGNDSRSAAKVSVLVSGSAASGEVSRSSPADEVSRLLTVYISESGASENLSGSSSAGDDSQAASEVYVSISGSGASDGISRSDASDISAAADDLLRSTSTDKVTLSKEGYAAVSWSNSNISGAGELALSYDWTRTNANLQTGPGKANRHRTPSN